MQGGRSRARGAEEGAQPEQGVSESENGVQGKGSGGFVGVLGMPGMPGDGSGRSQRFRGGGPGAPGVPGGPAPHLALSSRGGAEGAGGRGDRLLLLGAGDLAWDDPAWHRALRARKILEEHGAS